jgi:hypothetical protein
VPAEPTTRARDRDDDPAAAAHRRMHALPPQRVAELVDEVRRRQPGRRIPWREAKLGAAALDEQGWQAEPHLRGETA